MTSLRAAETARRIMETMPTTGVSSPWHSSDAIEAGLVEAYLCGRSEQIGEAGDAQPPSQDSSS